MTMVIVKFEVANFVIRQDSKNWALPPDIYDNGIAIGFINATWFEQPQLKTEVSIAALI